VTAALLRDAIERPLERLLRAADCVSRHCPLVGVTRGLVNDRTLAHDAPRRGSATEALARKMDLALLNVAQVLSGAEPVCRVS
jgi:hypothetical protein